MGRSGWTVLRAWWLSISAILVGCQAATMPASPAPGGNVEAGRIRLTGPREFFVSPSGSDEADGLTAQTPWQTLQHAYDTVKNQYDLAGYGATFQLEDGTYGPVNGKDNVVFCDGYIVGQVGDVRFVGNPNHPEKVVIEARANNIFEIMNTRVQVDGMTLTGTGSTVGMLSYFGARVTFRDVIFGPMGAGINLSAAGGIIIAFSDYSITGSTGYHMLSNTPGSRIDIDHRKITLVGTPTFSSAFAVAENLGLVSAFGNTFLGAGKGTRYIVARNGVMQTSGGADYFPGDAAGSTGTGGQYIDAR
jgi:hypothetical protein